MVDNFNKIRNLLEFRSQDDFYFLQILQRKKDFKEGKINGTNNNSRLIKAYYIKSLDYYDFIKPEVIELCKVFQARAGINLNRRSFKRTQLQTVKLLLDHQLNNTFNKTHQAFNSVCGKYSNEADKRWLLDIDESLSRKHNDMIRFAEEKCRPFGNKFISIIPSKSGSHIIMKPFDIRNFSEEYPEVEIHKNNPTNLFCP